MCLIVWRVWRGTERGQLGRMVLVGRSRARQEVREKVLRGRHTRRDWDVWWQEGEPSIVGASKRFMLSQCLFGSVDDRRPDEHGSEDVGRRNVEQRVALVGSDAASCGQVHAAWLCHLRGRPRLTSGLPRDPPDGRLLRVAEELQPHSRVVGPPLARDPPDGKLS